jgi:chemotaxis protein histidine kinase CheA
MTRIRNRKAELIPPDAYPQPVGKENAPHAVRKLRARSTAEQAMRVVEQKSESLREVIRRYVSALEGASSDMAAVFAIVHEIRGLAATAGLAATGRIADGLFRYLDEMQRAKASPDPMLVALHISAIIRAARAEDEASRMSEEVASELSMLVKRKLGELR